MEMQIVPTKTSNNTKNSAFTNSYLLSRLIFELLSFAFQTESHVPIRQ